MVFDDVIEHIDDFPSFQNLNTLRILRQRTQECEIATCQSLGHPIFREDGIFRSQSAHPIIMRKTFCKLPNELIVTEVPNTFRILQKTPYQRTASSNVALTGFCVFD